MTQISVASCGVTRDEVRAAILWAVEHDVVTLTEHRRVAHTTQDEWRRRRSDAALVARWRKATATAPAYR